MTSTASAPPTPTAQAPRPPALGVCESVPMISCAGKRVVLQHHLVDDAGARPPEAGAVLRRRRAQEVVDLRGSPRATRADRARPRRAPGSGDRSGSWSAPRPCSRRVCMNCSMAGLARARPGRRRGRGAGRDSSRRARSSCVLGIVEMSEQHLVRQRQRPAEPAAHDGEVALHRLIDLGRHLRRRFDRHHALNPLRVNRRCRA